MTPRRIGPRLITLDRPTEGASLGLGKAKLQALRLGDATMKHWLTYLLALLPWAAQSADSEQIGPFKIVAHKSSYVTGWNEGRLRRGELVSYRVHYQGRELSFRGPDEFSEKDVELGSELNRVISFKSPHPAVVVNAGDANNTSYYFLLSEANGELNVQLLTRITGGELRVAALDVTAENLGRDEMEFTRRLHFASAQLLLLGDYCVLDTRELQAYALDRIQERYPYSILPLGAAPDRSSFVRLVVGDDEQLSLQEIDFKQASSRYLPIDEARMRIASPYLIDASWLSHHFEWQPNQQGAYRLQARVDFQPLPYHSVANTSDPARPSYSWAPIRPDFCAWLIERLEQDFDAKPMPFSADDMTASMAGGADYFSREWRVGDGRIALATGDDTQGRYAALSAPWSQPATPDVLARIAAAVDAHLADGTLDTLFGRESPLEPSVERED